MTALILRAAALLVPAGQRAEWLAEWRAELWYARPHAFAFCLGAFPDAFWLRRNSDAVDRQPMLRIASPWLCFSGLALALAASMFFAARLSFPRDLLLTAPFDHTRNLAAISVRGSSVSIAQYRSLVDHTPPPFTGLAFYRPATAQVRIAANQTLEMSVTVASANYFELLHIPIPRHESTSLVLSKAAWEKYFHGHQALGVVEVDGQPAVVLTLISAGYFRLPAGVDAWLLEDQRHLDERPPGTTGFVIGHFNAHSLHPVERWSVSVGADRFECAALPEGHFILGHVLIVLISLLILSATTPLDAGDYPVNRRAGVFLAVKIGLLLCIAFCGSLDFASLTAASLYPQALLVSLTVAWRWAVLDQRQRCPVCLRLLSSPAPIGGPSQAFLGWYGTELVCAQGHGLLYVPRMPASCYGVQRWESLDPSWSSLFK